MRQMVFMVTFNNGLMILPPMALISVAVIIWVHRSINEDLQEK